MADGVESSRGLLARIPNRNVRNSMGHDYITYNDRHVHLHDMTLWSLRHFLILAASDLDHCVLEYVTAWRWQGPGVFTGTDLHEFVGDDITRVSLLRDVFIRARSIIREFGDSISLEYLELHMNLKMAYYAEPLRTSKLTDAIEKVLDIIPKN
jgi:hypothetical protein